MRCQSEKTRHGELTIGQRLIRTAGLCLIAICPACQAFAELGIMVLSDMLSDEADCESYYESSGIEGHVWFYTGKD